MNNKEKFSQIDAQLTDVVVHEIVRVLKKKIYKKL